LGKIVQLAPLSKETVSQIAVDFLKKRKNTEQKIEVSFVEAEGGSWVVSGACLMEIGGSNWPEKFSVVLDSKGKIKSSSFALL
jgi:hypothetical protein